jgi:hypothetical protein
MIPDAQIFIPTWDGDLAWLECCLKSIKKYWHSRWPTIIMADTGCRGKMPETPWSMHDVRFVDNWSDGRRDEVYLKMIADTIVDPSVELILYMDSDCLFTTGSCTSDFCVDGRPMVKMMSYRDAYRKWPQHRPAFDGYKRAVFECLNIGSEYEYMQVQPFLFFKDTVSKVRKTIETKKGQPLKDVMMRYASNQFSEFNLFGAYAHEQEDDRYCFLTPEDWGAPRVKQWHSWSQSPESERAEIDRILA